MNALAIAGLLATGLGLSALLVAEAWGSRPGAWVAKPLASTGFLVFALFKRFGYYAVPIMTIPYCMIHFDKPAAEVFGAIVAGMALGYLALRSKSWLPGAVLHWAVGISMGVRATLSRSARGAVWWDRPTTKSSIFRMTGGRPRNDPRSACSRGREERAPSNPRRTSRDAADECRDWPPSRRM